MTTILTNLSIFTEKGGCLFNMKDIIDSLLLHKQIIINIATVFVLPFLTGVVLRLVFGKSSKSYLVTVALLCLSVFFLILLLTVNTHGDEGLSINTCASLLVFAGSLISGAIIRLVRKQK